jgi:hypothetical protein
MNLGLAQMAQKMQKMHAFSACVNGVLQHAFTHAVVYSELKLQNFAVFSE